MLTTLYSLGMQRAARRDAFADDAKRLLTPPRTGLGRNMTDILQLSTNPFSYALDTRAGLSVAQLGASGANWTDAALRSPVFAVVVDGQRIDGQTAGLVARSVQAQSQDDAARTTLTLEHAARHITIEHHTITYTARRSSRPGSACAMMEHSRFASRAWIRSRSIYRRRRMS